MLEKENACTDKMMYRWVGGQTWVAAERRHVRQNHVLERRQLIRNLRRSSDLVEDEMRQNYIGKAEENQQTSPRGLPAMSTAS